VTKLQYILIVDDDATNLVRMKQTLAPLNYHTPTAANGAEALTELERLSGPHGFSGIVVTDLKMPVMDGLELLRLCYKRDADLPIILISAYGEISAAVDAMKSGAADFLERPVDVADLRARVTRALEKRALVLEGRSLRAESANRRLAAILIADASGYSRQSHRDEEGTRARFTSYQKQVFEPHIADHHGRLVKTMGDGLLVELPSVVNALRCAIDIQRALATYNREVPPEQEMHFRIGINLGDILVEGEDVQGEGVNIASRLQALAEPGGIVISGSAYDQVRNKVNVKLESLGEQTIKNIDEPIRVYRVAAFNPP
jgi:class 3 adenylate cyclase